MITWNQVKCWNAKQFLRYVEKCHKDKSGKMLIELEKVCLEKTYVIANSVKWIKCDLCAGEGGHFEDE